MSCTLIAVSLLQTNNLVVPIVINNRPLGSFIDCVFSVSPKGFTVSIVMFIFNAIIEQQK